MGGEHNSLFEFKLKLQKHALPHASECALLEVRERIVNREKKDALRPYMKMKDLLRMNW